MITADEEPPDDLESFSEFEKVRPADDAAAVVARSFATRPLPLFGEVGFLDARRGLAVLTSVSAIAQHSVSLARDGPPGFRKAQLEAVGTRAVASTGVCERGTLRGAHRVAKQPCPTA